MKGKRIIITEEKSELLKFAEEYIQKHYYMSSKDLAIAYDNIILTEQPSRGSIYGFAHILGDLREQGKIEKYNRRQYRRVGGV